MQPKMTRADRAKQFLPFDSLRGFYALVRDQEKIITPRKELSTDQLELLSYQYTKLKVGLIVTIEYYDVDGYIKKEGAISNIDEYNRTITIVTTKIKLDDISSIII